MYLDHRLEGKIQKDKKILIGKQMPDKEISLL